MALNWSIEDVKDWKELADSSDERAVTDALVWQTMVIGLNKITEKNWKEFYARIHLLEKLEGALLHQDGKPVFIKENDIQRRIGFHTNASAKSRTQYHKFMLDRFYKARGV